MGDHVVTFTLPGFRTVIRARASGWGSFTATLNVELEVGQLEETGDSVRRADCGRAQPYRSR